MLCYLKVLTQKKFVSFVCKNVSKVKHHKALSHTTEDNRIVTKISKAEIEITSPLESVLACAAACEIHTIQFVAKQNNVSIEKMEVEVVGDYDMGLFLGTSQGPNTFSKINVDFKIHSSEKDKKKLEETVHAGIQKCPVMNTLSLAGIKIHKKINYL